MHYTTLGRTGLNVSVMGLGAGGPSQLGRRTGKTEADSVAIIHQALAAGVNFIDTAEGYGTEELVGRALASVKRESVIVSSKKSIRADLKPAEVQTSLEGSLKRLGTDYIDIYSLHGVVLADYDYLYQNIVPALLRLQEQGKIRFIGITELFNPDPGHAMLQRALADPVWEVMMVGFNMLNQTARQRVLAQAIAQDIGVQIMFAVRAAFSRPERLAEIIQDLLDRGELEADEVDPDNPLGFLSEAGVAANLTDAAYRFCRYEPGAHVILSGTGNPAHLQANIESLTRPPLPAATVARLQHIFRRVESVTGQ